VEGFSCLHEGNNSIMKVMRLLMTSTQRPLLDDLVQFMDPDVFPQDPQACLVLIPYTVKLKRDKSCAGFIIRGLNGLDSTRLIQAAHPEIKIVILTVSEEDDDLFEAIKCGAVGYIQKSLDSDQFFDLLDAVLRGEVGMTPTLAGKILHDYARRRHPSPQPTIEELTPREHEVLELVAQGATNAEIAAQLGISENTVKFHMKNILQKLHASNRAEVVAYALKSGLIPIPPDDLD
jgi:DNA-binding NarL/FixJ family response regulator